MLNLAVLLEDHHRSRTPRATTPQHLVGTLRIGKGSLYNSFGGKRQLLDLALRRYLDLRITAATAALEGSGPAKERLRKALRLLRHRHPGATRYTQGVVRCRRRPRLPFGGWIVETGTNNSGGGHGGLGPAAAGHVPTQESADDEAEAAQSREADPKDGGGLGPGPPMNPGRPAPRRPALRRGRCPRAGCRGRPTPTRPIR